MHFCIQYSLHKFYSSGPVSGFDITACIVAIPLTYMFITLAVSNTLPSGYKTKDKSEIPWF